MKVYDFNKAKARMAQKDSDEFSRFIMSEASSAAKFKEAYLKASNPTWGDEDRRNDAMPYVKAWLKLKRATDIMQEVDNDLAGAIHCLYDLIRRESPISISDAISSLKYFSEAHFWEAYKTLVMIDVIEPGPMIELGDVGRILIDYEENENGHS